MIFNLHKVQSCSKQKNFLIRITCIFAYSIFSVLCSQFNVSALSSNRPPVLQPFNNGQLYTAYSYCDYGTNTDRWYVNCSNGYLSSTGTKIEDITNDDGSITEHWRFYWGNSNITNSKRIVIRMLSYGNFNNFLGDYSKPFFFNIDSEYNAYLGTGRPFFNPNDTGNRYIYNIGGFNAYLSDTNNNHRVSCPDLDPSICQLRYDWDTISGMQSYFYLSMNNGLPGSLNNYEYIRLLHNVYDQIENSYEWTISPDNSVLFLLSNSDLKYDSSTNKFYYDFYTTFYTTDEYYDMAASDSPGADVNDAISAEREYITDDTTAANGFNNLLSNINFSVLNPVLTWLNLFADYQCVDLNTLPSWFGTEPQHICSPWDQNIRSSITPLVAVGGVMLLFTFILKWLNSSEYFKGEIK